MSRAVLTVLRYSKKMANVTDMGFYELVVVQKEGQVRQANAYLIMKLCVHIF
jgi:hypothetical protein